MKSGFATLVAIILLLLSTTVDQDTFADQPSSPRYKITWDNPVMYPESQEWILYVDLTDRFELDELRSVAEEIMEKEGRELFISAEQRKRYWQYKTERTFQDTVLTDPMIQFYYPQCNPTMDDLMYGTARYSHAKIPLRRTLVVNINGMTRSQVVPLKADSLRAEGAIISWFSDATLIRYELVQKDTSFTMMIRYGNGKTVESKPLKQIAANLWRWDEDGENRKYSEFSYPPDRSILEVNGAWNGVEYDLAERIP